MFQIGEWKSLTNCRYTEIFTFYLFFYIPGEDVLICFVFVVFATETQLINLWIWLISGTTCRFFQSMITFPAFFGLLSQKSCLNAASLLIL